MAALVANSTTTSSSSSSSSSSTTTAAAAAAAAAYLQHPHPHPQQHQRTVPSYRQPPAAAAALDARPLALAVLGHSRSGKSTFIRNALAISPQHDLPSPTGPQLTTVHGNAVRLVELSFDDAPVLPAGHVSWPGTLCPPSHAPDGAFVLYDPSNRASLNHVGPLLAALLRASVPAALVACKWDIRPPHRRLAPSQLEQSSLLLDPSLALCASSDLPGSARHCLDTLLAVIALHSTDVDWLELSLPLRGLRPRRHTSSPRPPTAIKDARHARAASEFSSPPSSRPKDNEADAAVAAPAPRRNQGLRTPSTGPRQPSASVPDYRPQLSLSTTAPRYPRSAGLRSRSASQVLSPPGELEPDNVSDGASMASDESPGPDASFVSEPTSAAPSAFTLAELVEQLLIVPAGAGREKFIISFLALYRVFAAPCQVLERIALHFEHIQDPQNFLKTLGSPNGDLKILQQWLIEFPGDFAHDHTRKIIVGFLSHVREDPDHQEMAGRLLQLAEQCTADEDSEWGRTDDDLEKSSATLSQLSAISTTPSLSPSLIQPSYSALSAPHVSPEESGYRAASIFSQSSSTLGATHVDGGSFGSSQTTIASDAALREVSALIAHPLLPFTKEEWRTFMDIPDRSIAKELTRIDHAMFRLIRPRDLVRHATLSPEARSLFPGTQNVTRMIDHFNHLFLFCCNIVLFRDKAKHRALALAKLMSVGRELRKLNNYNSLGALVAGLKSASISRLGATWDLIDESRKRDFERLGMLMSISRGHSAYRMAWENTFGDRIPFLALARRDLVVAEQNKTFCVYDGSNIDSRESESLLTSHESLKINWRKFEIMGDVIASVRDAQLDTSYADIITPNDLVRAIVLNSKIIKDDEALYEWSIQLEAGVMSPASASVDQMKKRLGAFKKGYGLG